MSTTLAVMRAEVKLPIGNRDDVTDAMIDGWLNTSQLALTSRLKIYEVEAAATFLLGIGQDIYSDPLDFFLPMIIVNTSNNREKIHLKAIETILTTPSTPTNRVAQYGLRAKTLVFRPAPSTQDTLEITYKKRPPTMTATVNLMLPDEFAPAVVFDAIVRGMHLTGDEERAELYRNHRNDVLSGIGDVRGDEFNQRQDGAVITGFDVRLA